MRLINMTCPNCGAQLQVDADKKQVFCEHCGTKLLMDDNVYHIQYDNAEDAGYKFEKGRQRAMAESGMSGNQISPHERLQQTRYTEKKPTKKRKTWLWVFGWLFIFPVPLTILMLRKKGMKPAIKYGIIAVAWIIYLSIGAASNSSEDISTGKKEATPEVEVVKKENNEADVDKEINEKNTDKGTKVEHTDNMTKADDEADNNDSAFASKGLQPIEIVDCGYTLISEYGEYIIYYGIVLHNPNPDYYCEYPTFRIIAEDESGNVIDTEEDSIQYLNGNRTSGYAGLGFNLQEKPAKVSFEIVEKPDNWVKGTSGDLGLEATNLSKTIDGGFGTIAGKINNTTDNTYDSVSVSVIFRDSDGNILGGDSSYIDNVKAKGTTAFSIDLLSKEYMSDRYDLYFHNDGFNTYDTVIEGKDATFVNTD